VTVVSHTDGPAPGKEEKAGYRLYLCIRLEYYCTV